MIKISKPQVLQSNAGYYIGTLYFDGEFWLPYERLSSEYWPTKDDAEAHLEKYKSA